MNADDWWKLGTSTLNVLVTAAAGFGGVYYGQYRARGRDEHQQLQERAYLAAVLSAPLDAYIQGCVDVTYDDGTSCGQPAGENGYYAATVTAPAFDPHTFKVNWAALPAELIDDIFSIPTKQLTAERYLSSDAFDDPPDYAAYFWERGHEFAKLGEQAMQIFARLRQSASLVAEQSSKISTLRHERFRQTIEDFNAWEAKRNEAHTKSMEGWLRSEPSPALANVDSHSGVVTYGAR